MDKDKAIRELQERAKDYELNFNKHNKYKLMKAMLMAVRVGMKREEIDKIIVDSAKEARGENEQEQK